MSKIIIQELGGSSVGASWKVETDNKYTYLTRDGVDQKIKVSDSLTSVIRGFSDNCFVNSFADDRISVRQFVIDRNFVLLNNTKNMNPLLYEPHGYADNQDLLIITLSKGYKLLTYQLSGSAEIRSSFHSDQMYGCIITFNSSLDCYSSESKPIISLQCLKEENGYTRYVDVKSVMNGDNLSIIETEITATDKLGIFSSVQKRFPDGVGFKMQVKNPATEIYITVQEKVSELINLLSESRIREPAIYTVTDPTDAKECEKLLKKLQENNGIRAITVYGMTIDLSAIRNAKILYVFILDETSKVTCIKSL